MNIIWVMGRRVIRDERKMAKDKTTTEGDDLAMMELSLKGPLMSPREKTAG